MPRNRHDAHVPRLAAHQRRGPRTLRAYQARARETDVEARPELRRRQDLSRRGNCRARPRCLAQPQALEVGCGDSEIGTGFACAKLSEILSSPRVAQVVRMTKRSRTARVFRM